MNGKVVLCAVLSAALNGCGAQAPSSMSGGLPDEGVAGGAAQTVAGDAPAPPMRRAGASLLDLVPVEIWDRKGFEQPMVAVQVPVPAGWQAGGSLTWSSTAACPGLPVRIKWSAAAPDGSGEIGLLPGFVWQVAGSQYPMNFPCPIKPWPDVRSYLLAAVRLLRPDAQVLDFRTIPELARLAQATSPASTATVQHLWSAGRVRVAYRDQGTERHALVAAVMHLIDDRGYRRAIVDQVAYYSAPAGRLQVGLLARILRGAKPNPAWQERAIPRAQAIASHTIAVWNEGEIAKINRRGAIARHRIRMDTMRDIAAMRTDSFRRRSASMDRIQRATIDAIRDENRYAGVDGDDVLVDINAGERVFQSTIDPDQVISTDDPLADPPLDYVELERVD